MKKFIIFKQSSSYYVYLFKAYNINLHIVPLIKSSWSYLNFTWVLFSLFYESSKWFKYIFQLKVDFLTNEHLTLNKVNA